jgi:hypothetical protein
MSALVAMAVLAACTFMCGTPFAFASIFPACKGKMRTKRRAYSFRYYQSQVESALS